MIANHGQKKKYYHEVVGCNSRLDTIQAAVLSVKLPHLDEYCKARQAAAAFYDGAFAGNPNIVTPLRAPYSMHVFHQYTLRLKGVNRDSVQKKLTAKGIPSMIYYPVPCHKQGMFGTLGVQNVELPVTNQLQNEVLSLPIHTELSNEELKYIASTVIDIVNELVSTPSVELV